MLIKKAAFGKFVTAAFKVFFQLPVSCATSVAPICASPTAKKLKLLGSPVLTV
jgi:hypothetical protein